MRILSGGRRARTRAREVVRAKDCQRPTLKGRVLFARRVICYLYIRVSRSRVKFLMVNFAIRVAGETDTRPDDRDAARFRLHRLRVRPSSSSPEAEDVLGSLSGACKCQNKNNFR